MMRKIISMMAVVFTAALGKAEVRNWTNNKGQNIKAELIEVDGDKAVLKMGEKTYPVPIDTLSAADQKFIDVWQKANMKVSEEEGKSEDGEASNGGGEGKKLEYDPDFENWDEPWPKLISTDVSPEIEIIQENPEGYIYASPNYEFHVDTKLSKSVVKRFAVLFEATNEFCRALPISMAKARSTKRFKIMLFETQSSYFAAGGPPGSAGVYMGGKDIIMVPLTSLGVEKVGNRYIVDYDKGNKTLPHEILHQLTDHVYYADGVRGWFTEGLAEYVGTTPYRSGKFSVDNINSLKAYVTAYGRDDSGGRAIGTNIRMPDIKDWMLQSYSSFLSNPQVNYGVGALVTYYFFHMDGNKDAARIKAFLKAVKEGKKGEEALEVLLDGRTYDQLEEEITKAWRGRGVKFEWR